MLEESKRANCTFAQRDFARVSTAFHLLHYWIEHFSQTCTYSSCQCTFSPKRSRIALTPLLHAVSSILIYMSLTPLLNWAPRIMLVFNHFPVIHLVVLSSYFPAKILYNSIISPLILLYFKVCINISMYTLWLIHLACIHYAYHVICTYTPL